VTSSSSSSSATSDATAATTSGTATTEESEGGSRGLASSDENGVLPVDADEYLDRSLRDQVAAMEAGRLSSEDLVQGYLGRIDDRDRGADGIGAILATVPNPLAAARALDPDRGLGRSLQGAIVLVKDNLDMIDLPTTAGSLALANNLPAQDAPAVARLRAAGALLLGKTNLSEWANFRGNESTSGWSSVGGQTRNGVDPNYNPCGSSSGSAAAVAAGLASAAIGTETDGSITCPASVNGVVGFKPTVGLVSRTGIVPISHSQDTAGPITKTVGDAARMLTALAGPDPLDTATAAIPLDLEFDFEVGLDRASLAGARLGVVSNLRSPDPDVDALFELELARIADAGATLIEVDLPSSALYEQDEFTVLLYEFKVDLEAYLVGHARADQPTTLAQLIAFNEANADVVMPYFGQELFEAADRTEGLDDPDYVVALERARRTIGLDGIAAVLAAQQLDALVAPTTGPAWITDYDGGDPSVASASAPAAVAGYPHLTVPMGQIDGLPVGLSWFAGPWQDGKVLALGYAYEQL